MFEMKLKKLNNLLDVLKLGGISIEPKVHSNLFSQSNHKHFFALHKIASLIKDGQFRMVPAPIPIPPWHSDSDSTLALSATGTQHWKG